MLSHLFLIILVAAGCGLAGGVRNFFLIPEKHRVGAALARSLLDALGAALIIPLFLSVIGNDVAVTVLSGSAGNEKWLYAVVKLIGFCILAAFYSRNFLADMSAKLLKFETELQEERQKTNELKEDISRAKQEVASTSEQVDKLESLVVEDPVPTSVPLTAPGITEEQSKVLRTFAEGSVPARSVEGLALSTGISAERLQPILQGLCAIGYLKQIDTKRGSRWALSATGYLFAQRDSLKGQNA